jgi:hypothetical protein
MVMRFGTADRRAALIVGTSFLAGLVCATLLCAPTFFDPIAEPYFGLEDVPVEAEGSALAVAAELRPEGVPPVDAPPREPSPVAAATPAAVPAAEGVGDLAHMAAVLAAQPPERLALGDTAAPISRAVEAQALPTGGSAAVDSASPASEPVVPEPPAAASAFQEEGSQEPTDVDPQALRELAARVQPRPLPTADAARADSGAVPLPGEEWNDPDGVNWTDPAPGSDRDPDPRRTVRLLERIADRRTDGRAAGAAPPAGRILDRLRSGPLGGLRGDRRPGDDRIASLDPGDGESAPDAIRWPDPTRLVAQLKALSSAKQAESARWADAAFDTLQSALATGGPRDDGAEAALITLGESVPEGMTVADGLADAALASQTRRAALALARRVAVWRAAAAFCREIEDRPREAVTGEVAAGLAAEVSAAEAIRLLGWLERYESSRSAADAAGVKRAVHDIGAAPVPGAAALCHAVEEHYLSPNFRLAVHREFVERMLPRSTVQSGPFQDFVLGRKVRGTRTVEQTTAVRFNPHPSEIRMELVVSGEVASRSVAEAGPAEVHSRSQASFTVAKPIQVSANGLALGAARGSASNQTQLANVQTSFDGVPLVGSLARGIVRNQHDEHRDDARREVNQKIISRACREVDGQAEPRLAEMGDEIRTRAWEPLVRMGLEPRAVALETTSDVATARLRLAGAAQLAAHTPRPRAPADALLSLQVHESSVNNAFERFGLAGRKLGLEDLARLVCERLGLPPRVPEDLPEGVEVTFAAVEPLRVECRDGLVHVHVSLDALESGRRSWHDIVSHVAYKPLTSGAQVLLERDGPVQLSGPGHQGRMEIALRTIFGKVFAKERPVRLLPERIVANPRLANVRAVQAVCADGWLAFALAQPKEAAGGTSPTAAADLVPGLRTLRR